MANYSSINNISYQSELETPKKKVREFFNELEQLSMKMNEDKFEIYGLKQLNSSQKNDIEKDLVSNSIKGLYPPLIESRLRKRSYFESECAEGIDQANKKTKPLYSDSQSSPSCMSLSLGSQELIKRPTISVEGSENEYFGLPTSKVNNESYYSNEL